MQLNENDQNPQVLDQRTDKNNELEYCTNIMYTIYVHKGGAMRPQLTQRAQTIVQLFLDRKIFETQANVVEEALELLLENQLQKESHDDRGSVLGEEFLLAQSEVLEK